MTDATAVQLTLTGTLLGLALGQVLIGPLSDALGRRRPLIAGLATHVFASLLCVVAPTIGVLGVLRVLQGLGTAAATVVATLTGVGRSTVDDFVSSLVEISDDEWQDLVAAHPAPAATESTVPAP